MRMQTHREEEGHHIYRFCDLVSGVKRMLSGLRIIHDSVGVTMAKRRPLYEAYVLV